MAAAACEYRDVILHVHGVSHSLGGKPVLRDVNLEIRDLYRPGYTQGQVVGLLGPSGMGKTDERDVRRFETFRGSLGFRGGSVGLRGGPCGVPADL